MTRSALRILPVVLLLLASTLQTRDASAQVRSDLAHHFNKTSDFESVTTRMQGERAFQYGPTVGYDLDPDAITVGAFLIAHGFIESLAALKFMVDAVYGFGTEDFGGVDYSTIRVAVTALYLVALSSTSMSLYPLAGLAYYRFKVSEEVSGFGFSASDSDIALVAGALLAINQIFVRAMVGLGGSSDLSLSVGYMLGTQPS